MNNHGFQRCNYSNKLLREICLKISHPFKTVSCNKLYENVRYSPLTLSKYDFMGMLFRGIICTASGFCRYYPSDIFCIGWILFHLILQSLICALGRSHDDLKVVFCFMHTAPSHYHNKVWVSHQSPRFIYPSVNLYKWWRIIFPCKTKLSAIQNFIEHNTESIHSKYHSDKMTAKLCAIGCAHILKIALTVI